MNEKEKRKLIRGCKSTLIEEYEVEMKETARDELIWSATSFLLMRNDEQNMIDSFRNTLEAQAFGSLLSEAIDNGNTRENLQVLLEGSPLGDMLTDVFQEWDHDIGRKELKVMFDEVIEEISSYLSEEFFDLDDEFVLDDDDDDPEEALTNRLAEIDVPMN